MPTTRRTDLDVSSVREGELLWTPGPEQIEFANITRYTRWLQRERSLTFDSYRELWEWSIRDLDAFWQSIWDYFGVKCSVAPDKVLGRREMPGAEWFPGARLNYAENVLSHETPGANAVMGLSETEPLTGVPWEDFANGVRILATELRERGVGPGDRVAAYMPNIPETAIAMLATTSIGAIWASCSPDFGAHGVLDRLAQLSPKVLFCVDGYRYGGKAYDRSDRLREIVDGLDSLEHVIFRPYLNPAQRDDLPVKATLWQDLMDRPPVPAEEFEFEQLPFDHPLWILFSSGTTGLPKAIVHSHGGILVEQLKLLHFHMDLHAGDRMFFFTTTGWMMWNFLMSSILAGVCPVLYDGNPTYPGVDVLWKMADEAGVALFGASPTYVDMLSAAGVEPGARYDLANLRGIVPAGSPVSPAHSAWFYRNVKSDLWLATGSGGTDVCAGLVGGVPTLPVYAGEIQAPSLGVAARAFDEQGHSVVNEVGELVITQPLPSMPVALWGDDNFERYRDSYFDKYPGVWRHGDLFRVNERGGCFVLGRSDATLNRYGVRIGTAEIYRALADLPEIEESLIVNLDLPGGGFFMPLFVKLAEGVDWSPELEKKVRDHLRQEYTPRHVPDAIYPVPDIPMTLTGKKMEVPIRRILLGADISKAANPNAMANPEALQFFARFASELEPGKGERKG
ncbi:MAG TPA: acetoacetate--CoA ligase [Gammaproteobacteria bacterium]|nr:acetoacetate--CoA ligase [Gammaproteobacteria bacterium]